MPAYAYKIKINYKKEDICEEKTEILDTQGLTITMLAPLVGENVFSVTNTDYGESLICWDEWRKETDDEYKTRIERLEKYNAEYERRNTK